MINSVSVQTLEFLYSALLGVGLGVLFDVIRVIRVYIPKSRVITAVLDVLYWIFAIIALLAFIMTVCGGRMRWYVLLGAFSGGFVYIAALSEIVFKVFRASVLILKKLLSLITRPVFLLLRGVWRTGKKTERNLSKSIVKKRANRREKKKRKASQKTHEKEGESEWQQEEKREKQDCFQS